MEITSPQNKRMVDDYDILFTTGLLLPITVDKTQGDSIEILEKTISIKITAKPSINDPTKKTLAEDFLIFTRYLASVQHREREIADLTPIEREEWQKAFKQLSDSVN